MKKILIVILCVLLVTASAACGKKDERNLEDLDYLNESLGFGFSVPEGFTVDDSDPDGFVYVFMESRSIPLIMIRKYTGNLNMQSFLSEYTQSVLDTFEGAVLSDTVNNNIGGKKVVVLTFTYELNGYQIEDSRAVYENGTDFYVFTEKTVPSLGQSLNGPLDYLMKSFTIL